MVDADLDRTGLDETKNHLADALGRFVPQSVARRVIAVTVSTDQEEYAPGEPVRIDIEFRNRLPVPVTIKTPKARLWGWTVDGTLEATEERLTNEAPPDPQRRIPSRELCRSMSQPAIPDPPCWAIHSGSAEIG